MIGTMSKAKRSLGRQGRADELLAQRLLFDAAWAFVWKTLARYRLAEADRRDVAQEVLIAAWRGRTGYRQERGNPEQWLSRVVRNTAVDFLTKRGKDPLAMGIGWRPDTPSSEWPLEERISLRDVAEITFAALPDGERRAVIAIAIEERSFRELAALEDISPSTAHDRYERGIAALRAAVEGAEDRKAFAILPLAFAEHLGPDDLADPPAEWVEQAWRRAVAELGLDRAPGSDPPASGTRRTEPVPADDGTAPPSSSPQRRRRLSRMLGRLAPLGGVLIGGLLASTLPHGCARDHAHDERSMATTAGPAVIAATPTTSEPAPSSAASTMAAAGSPTGEPAPAATAPPAAHAYRDVFDLERALLDRGRSAIGSGEMARALDALAEHAQRFPNGQNAAARARLWTLACAQGDAAVVDARCSQHP